MERLNREVLLEKVLSSLYLTVPGTEIDLLRKHINHTIDIAFEPEYRKGHVIFSSLDSMIEGGTGTVTIVPSTEIPGIRQRHSDLDHIQPEKDPVAILSIVADELIAHHLLMAASEEENIPTRRRLHLLEEMAVYIALKKDPNVLAREHKFADSSWLAFILKYRDLKKERKLIFMSLWGAIPEQLSQDGS